MALENLDDAQRAWLLRAEALRRRAQAIVASYPHLDEGDVYHALWKLQLPPSERLRQGLTHVRPEAKKLQRR